MACPRELFLGIADLRKDLNRCIQDIDQIEQELYEQRRQRPYFEPKIRILQQRLQAAIEEKKEILQQLDAIDF